MEKPKRLRAPQTWAAVKQACTQFAASVADRRRAAAFFGMVRDELHLRARRAFLYCHEALAGRRYAAPISFLSIAGTIGLLLVCTTLYSFSYAVYVDGENVGTVADREVVAEAISSVEASGSSILGYDYTIDNAISYRPGLTRRDALDTKATFVNYFYTHIDSGEDEGLRQYEVVVGGRSVGVVDSKSAFNAVLQDIRNTYMNENTLSAEFVEEIELKPVFAADRVVTAEEMRHLLTDSTAGETTYAVVSGDTFGKIAYRNDMSVSDLKALNPGVNIDKLAIGQVLNVRELIPALSVRTTEQITYQETIPCPVVTREDSSLYKGSSKIISKGVEGSAQVTASVYRVNGIEKERTELERTVLVEPTSTIKAVGTKEKPKTASSGSFAWPCKGRLTSYFGYRKIFGSRSYHSGIDIAGAYGTPIKAADGGKVTFAGSKGAYGYLVIITHDNGTQTYYGHNSSLLVSAGQRVYKGQTIAKMGSTGRSTGNHCHFEVRIRGSAVNPLTYLK